MRRDKSASIEAALDDVRLGMSYRAAAEKRGLSATTVAYWAKRHGVPSPGRRRVFDHEAIMRDIQEGGMTFADIARKHGCSPSLVSKIAKGSR